MAHGRAPALLLLALALALLATACGDDGGEPEGDLEPVVFMAGFRPQANLPFVAVYVADAQGFFRDEGLDVEVRHSSQGEHLQLLLAGEVDFTTGTAAQALRRRADGLPVRAVALFGQRGDQGFVVRADSGIEEPSDFADRSVGFKGGVVPAELLALLATAGLDADDVRLQAVGFDERIFIERQVDVFPVFLDNEPYAIRKAGVEITVFDPADYGVSTLGVVYLATDGTAAERPELVERFLRAALRGAAYAATHIEEALDVTLVYAPGADREQQRFLLETDLANAARADGLGRGDLEQWRAMQDVLARYDPEFAGAIDVSEVFDGSFVDGLYGEDGELK